MKREARVLQKRVQVLAVDYLTVGDSNQAAAASPDGEAAAPTAAVQKGLITFIVPPKAAQVLASVPTSSMILTLVSKDYEPVPMPPVDLGVYPGEASGELTPYGPDGARKSN